MSMTLPLSNLAPRLIGWRYGLLGLPLAFVSLPLYVTLPHHYADRYGVSLAALGAVLLATRSLDAVLDPLIGRLVDRLFARNTQYAWHVAVAGGVLMALAFAALWWPPQPSMVTAGASADSANLLIWLSAALMLTYLAFSVVSIVHQAWGARWGGTEQMRARIVAWRESAALLGVVLASLLPAWLGLPAMSLVLALGLAVGVLLLARSGQMPEASALPDLADTPAALGASPWASPAFRALLAVFMLNGIAAAIPATLLPFFVSNLLQAPGQTPLFLAAYFVCAALGLPLWVRLVASLGLTRSWLLGMALSIATFAAVPTLVAGDVYQFYVICAASGMALGADLAIPGALLTGVVQQSGAARRGEGQFFGWWACATKLNLALAAGLTLPLLALAGYSNGAREPSALIALSLAYGALPCALKLGAAALLWRTQHHYPRPGVHP